MKERTARGTAVVNLLPLAPDETIQAIVATRDFDSGGFLTFATKAGQVKKTAFTEYDKSRREGFIAIALRDGDELVRVVATSGDDDVVMVSHNGSGIRFSEHDVRPMGRDAAGVRGMRLRSGDEVVSLDVVRPDADVLIVADAKRGDIGPTNEGYAEAWLHERSPLVADAVTASPYVGLVALAPLLTLAHAHGRGVFVLAATTNDDGRVVQLARTDEDERVEDFVLRSVAELNQRDDGLGTVGAVLGATRDQPLFNLASLGGPFLVPGVGSQGATAQHVARLFDRCPGATVLASVSRAILQAGPDRAALPAVRGYS